MTWIRCVIFFLLINSTVGVMLPFCGNKNVLSNAKLCTTVNDTSLDLGLLDNHIEVKPILRVLDFVNLNWDENTVTIFLQLKAYWNETRLKVIDE